VGKGVCEPAVARAGEGRFQQARGTEALVVAERGGDILCFASLRLVPSLDSAPYAELSDLFVAGPYRRQGVGRRLLEFIEHLSRERGADRLVLTAGLKNVDAPWFYRAVRFGDHAPSIRQAPGHGRS